MLDYDSTMRAGAARYQDVLGALRVAGLPATFTQTGGMCAALEVMLDSGHTLLITDAEDSLAWERDEHQGWGVGLYRPGSEHDDGPLAFDSTHDGRGPALVTIVDAVLETYRHDLRRRP